MSPTERQALADRLTDHADSIENITAHQMEQDLRLAASELRAIEMPRLRVTLPALHHELARLAESCPDAATAAQILFIMGDRI